MNTQAANHARQRAEPPGLPSSSQALPLVPHAAPPPLAAWPASATSSSPTWTLRGLGGPSRHCPPPRPAICRVAGLTCRRPQLQSQPVRAAAAAAAASPRPGPPLGWPPDAGWPPPPPGRPPQLWSPGPLPQPSPLLRESGRPAPGPPARLPECRAQLPCRWRWPGPGERGRLSGEGSAGGASASERQWKRLSLPQGLHLAQSLLQHQDPDPAAASFPSSTPGDRT